MLRANDKKEIARYVTRASLPVQLREELELAAEGAAERLQAFLAVNWNPRKPSMDTRTPHGTRKAGLFLRYDNHHGSSEAGAVGHWLCNVAHPEVVTPLVPLIQAAWRVFSAYEPDKAALAMRYVTRLAAHGADVAPGTGFTSVWVADRTAVAHRDVHVANKEWPFGDVVLVIHTKPGLVCGGELVFVDHATGTRVAFEMGHLSFAFMDAWSDVHASVPVTTAEGEHRLVLSLFCDVRLLEGLESGKETRWLNYPPTAEETATARTRCRCAGCKG